MAKAEPPNSYHRDVSVLYLTWRSGSSYSEGSRSISGSCPSPATVQAEALIGDDLEDTTAAESLGVGLSLDLQDVERQENNLTNADQTTLVSVTVPASFGVILVPFTFQRWSA